MPFGFGKSRASKKKTYTVQEYHEPPHRSAGEDKHSAKGKNPLSAAVRNKGRRNTAPAGILKRGGARPVSFPALLEAGMVPSEMAAAIPMPTEAELNELFVEMVVSSWIDGWMEGGSTHNVHDTS